MDKWEYKEITIDEKLKFGRTNGVSDINSKITTMTSEGWTLLSCESGDDCSKFRLKFKRLR